MTLFHTFLSPIITTAVHTNDRDPSSFWMPPQASTIAEPVDQIFAFVYWLNVVCFVLIVALMIFFAIKYRRAPGERAGKMVNHHLPLEITWTVIPLIIVTVLFWAGLKAYADMTEVPKNAYEIQVTAQKWAWTFEHRNGAVESNRELHVPVGRPVKFTMSSRDVLHSMFIPSFRVKQDVVPGRYTSLWFEAKETGSYQIFCAEYCGTDHARMTAIVNVLPEEEFQAKIADIANEIKTLAIEDYPDYFLRRIYPRCESCHTLDRSTNQGPGFAVTAGHWGTERPLRTGTAVVDENYIRESMLNPQAKIVPDMPGTMTTFQGAIKEKEILASIEFFKRFSEYVDENGQRIGQ